MIALDTNVLQGLSFPGDLDLSMLSELAKELHHRLLLPSLVVDEYLAHRRQEYEQDIQKARAAANAMTRLPFWDGQVRWSDLPLPVADDEVNRIKKLLDGRFDTLPLKAEEAIEALRRETYREPPTRDGAGARDAAIWLSLVSWCRKHSEDVFFATADNGFSDVRLSDERPPNLHVVNGLDGVLAKIASPSNAPVNVPELLGDPMVLSVVGETAPRVEAFDGIGGLGLKVVAGPNWWYSPEVLRVHNIAQAKGGTKHRSYEVNGQQWVSMRVTWSVRLMMTGSGEVQQWHLGYEFDTTLVFRLKAEGRFDLLALAHVGPLRNVQSYLIPSGFGEQSA